VKWEIIRDDDFAAWFDSELSEPVQDAIAAALSVLADRGPMLGRPLVDTIKGAPLPNLKELRVQHGGEPWRVMFAFDPTRRAVLLVGGNKGGDARWYVTNIPIAAERAKRHGIR
jgi:hypothetical protein